MNIHDKKCVAISPASDPRGGERQLSECIMRIVQVNQSNPTKIRQYCFISLAVLSPIFPPFSTVLN